MQRPGFFFKAFAATLYPSRLIQPTPPSKPSPFHTSPASHHPKLLWENKFRSYCWDPLSTCRQMDDSPSLLSSYRQHQVSCRGSSTFPSHRHGFLLPVDGSCFPPAPWF